MVRPGVWETITSATEATTDETSVKGQSYLYRWALWRKAYKEICKSPERVLFGYGLGSHQIMNLTDIQDYGEDKGRKIDYGSWDNHYACMLLETGFLGFFTFLTINFMVIVKIYKLWSKRILDCIGRNVIAAILSSVLVMVFMMSNVYIFSTQLTYLYWFLIAYVLSSESETT
jgi:hypothetical protein